MFNQLHLNDYKQEIADLYTHRSPTYDTSDWHLQIARRLVEYGQVSSGQQVLDIATGTGHAALAAAEIVGRQAGFWVLIFHLECSIEPDKKL